MKIRWREITDPTGKNPVQWIEWKSKKSEGQCVACPEWIKSYLGEHLARIILIDLVGGRRSGVVDDGDYSGPHYRVVVGNIGEVFDGNDNEIAAIVFEHYVDCSKENVGRAAHEPVTMFRDDEIIREYAWSCPACDGTGLQEGPGKYPIPCSACGGEAGGA